ncbi:MAG TPA: non-ribosomal peptide synthetase, partial [Acidobacteria bacterium]|nr:non-ribosomal peptide synthetase [Acidobacteriota bacterium]
DGRQQILGEVPRLEIPILDLVGRPAAEAEAVLQEVRARLSHQMLPVDRWPLFEIVISRLSAERIRIHLSFDLLIADAWSSQLLLREFALLAHDPAAPLAPLELTFRDYLLASERLTETAAWARARAYWERRLPEIPPAPQLPLAKDPATVGKPQFVRRAARLEAPAWQRLQERSAAAGLTPSGLLLAAYAEILAAWSAGPRFTLNVTTFNRLPIHPQINEVVGDFTSLTLVAADLAGADGFELRARRLQEQLWEDLDHRQVSGVQVVRDLARQQGRSPGALMPVVFTSRLFHGGAAAAPAPAGPRGEIVYAVSQTPQVWLDKQVSEEDGVLVWSWDAVEELFPEGLLDDMFAAFHSLLCRLAEDAGTWSAPPRPRLPEAQLARRAAVNATAAPVAEVTLDALVGARAAAEPERPAVVTAERTLTYGELWHRSGQVARWLCERGAGPDRLVAVGMEKGWEQAVAALGVVRAGAAYLPIDPAWPDERRFYLCAHGGAELALVQERLAGELVWPAGVTAVAVDGDEIARQEEAPAASPATPSSLAYAIFTSGSTGRPKGVAIEHRSAANTILDVNRRFAVGPEDRVLALSSLSFDLSVWDLFGLLAAGGALVMPEPWAGRDPSRWAALSREHGVTLWNSVPALLELLLEHAEGREGAIPETLRLALLSGDWLPLDVASRLRRQVPAAQVVSLGGATEASIWSILYPVGEVAPEWKSIPYGKPMVNQSFHVLDARLRPRPEWVPGDLYIGGVGLARCYWGDEEKTAASFVVHPESGERLYRTGDLGRPLPGGDIEFLGRADFQVKIQGYRIELGEIEAVLAGHPGLAAAVVAAPELRPGAGQVRGARRLVAYVVPRAGEPVEVDELRAFLGERLPAYMVPALFIELESLPLTANGKVDRKALPAPDRGADPTATAARTPVERRLAAVWAEMLGVESVGVHDNLFDLGGNSLIAIQLVNEIRESFGVEISLTALFEHLTIASLAGAIARLRAGGDAEAQLAARLPALIPDPAARWEPFPLNDVQQAYWVGRLNVFDLGNVAAHSYTEVERSDFDIAVFTAAFRQVIARHDALRLVFLRDGRQRILAEVPPYEVAVLDLRGRPREEAEAELQAVRAHLSHQVLPADRWPLFEVRVSRLDGGRMRVHLSFDLLIADAWSSEILFRELGQAIADPRPDLFAPLEISFRDYVMAEQAIKATELYRRSEAYWQERLPTLPPAPELPIDLEKAGPAPRFRRFAGHLADAAWARLRGRAAEIGVTPSGILLAAFAEVLAAWSRRPRFTINVTTFNRLPLHPQVNALMGDFTSLTFLAADTTPLAAADTFALRARRLQEQLWQDLDHRYFGGVKVLRELARMQGRAAAVLMPVVFTSRLFGTGRSESAGAAGEEAARREAESGEVVYSVSQTPQVWL